MAVPEAVHQLRQLPGLQVLSAEGTLVQGMADPGLLDQLREHRLVRGVEVTPGVPPPERLEPWAASLATGLVELLHQPGVQLLLLLGAARLWLGRRGP